MSDDKLKKVKELLENIKNKKEQLNKLKPEQEKRAEEILKKLKAKRPGSDLNGLGDLLKEIKKPSQPDADTPKTQYDPDSPITNELLQYLNSINDDYDKIIEMLKLPKIAGKLELPSKTKETETPSKTETPSQEQALGDLKKLEDFKKALGAIGDYDATNIVLTALQGVYLTLKVKNGLEGEELENVYASNIANELEKNDYISKQIGSKNPLLQPIGNVELKTGKKSIQDMLGGGDPELAKYGKQFLKKYGDLKTEEFVKKAIEELKKVNDPETSGAIKSILKSQFEHQENRIKEMNGLDALLAFRLVNTTAMTGQKGNDIISAIPVIKKDEYGKGIYSLLDVPEEYESTTQTTTAEATA
jgi:hypothetical protein